MALYAHRANYIKDVLDLYEKYHHIHAFELDVQPTIDGVLVVHHDDVSGVLHQDLPDDVVLFKDYVSQCPKGVRLNVEIKKYGGSAFVASEVYDVLEDYRDLLCVFSSFDYTTYRWFEMRGIPCWFLLKDMSGYRPDIENLCIHKSLLRIVNHTRHAISVYDVKYGDELSQMTLRYPLVRAWIVDFPTLAS